MVSTVRFRSFKTFDLGARRSYTVLLLVAVGLVVVVAQPEYLFVVMAYGYLASAFVELAWTRLRRRHGQEEPKADTGTTTTTDTTDSKDTKALYAPPPLDTPASAIGPRVRELPENMLPPLGVTMSPPRESPELRSLRQLL
jgi:hypothetical protein